MLAIPGALTPTELMQAQENGAKVVKIFPCDNVGGAKYLKSLKDPFPNATLIPTGGLNANAAEYIAAGAFAPGVGGELADAAALRAGNLAKSRKRRANSCRQCRRFVRLPTRRRVHSNEVLRLRSANRIEIASIFEPVWKPGFMAENGRVKVGIIGSQFAADIHASAFRQAGDEAEVVAVASPTPGNAATLTAKYSIPRVFADYREMLKQSDIEMVTRM
jgi:hypothetical protein